MNVSSKNYKYNKEIEKRKNKREIFDGFIQNILK